MVKKFVLMVILLATTAFTVIFGDSFHLPFIDPEPTATSTSTIPAGGIATISITSTTEPTETLALTNTPVNTESPASTATPEATATLTNTPMNTPTSTATATPTEDSFLDLFRIQDGSPVSMANFSHPTEGCVWQGVAGQVFSSSGLPLVNYIVKITGTYNGISINQIGLTGLVANNPYGPGSFEFILGNSAVDSQNQLNLQLFNPDGQEVIRPISINTYADCARNLQIINFQQK